MQRDNSFETKERIPLQGKMPIHFSVPHLWVSPQLWTLTHECQKDYEPEPMRAFRPESPLSIAY